jgi:hypothetical protein
VRLARDAFHPAGGVARKTLPPSLVRVRLVEEARFFVVRSSGTGGGTVTGVRLAGVFNVLQLLGANLIGFVLGVDGARYFAAHVRV